MGNSGWRRIRPFGNWRGYYAIFTAADSNADTHGYSDYSSYSYSGAYRADGYRYADCDGANNCHAGSGHSDSNPGAGDAYRYAPAYQTLHHTDNGVI